MEKIRRFMLNAVILGAASVFMRTVSVLWSSYITARIGAEGMGLFSLIMSVYFFAVTLASSGVNLAVTRLVAQALGAGEKAKVICIVRRAVCYCLLFGITAGVVLFWGADFFAIRFLSDARTALSLRALSVSLPFIALSNVFSGYFTAVRRVQKNAGSNLIEQFIKIGVTALLLFMIASRGIEYACLALVLGTSISEGLSFLWLFLLYRRDKRKYIGHPKESGNGKKIFSEILSIALPIALSSYIRSGLVTVEHILIPKGLKKHGADYAQALAAYGTVHGMSIPLIYFPLAVCTTFAGLLVPELSELDTGKAAVHGNKYIAYIIHRAIKFTAVFGIGTAGILICFANPIGNLVYPNTDAGKYVCILAAVVPISYLDTVVDGMLKGLGEQLASMRYNIIDAAVSVAIVYIFVPKYGIAGYIGCVFVTEILNFSLSVSRLLRVSGARLSVLSLTARPVICIAGAVMLANLICRLLPVKSNLLFCLVAICLSVLLYLLFLIGTKGINREERAWIKNAFFPKKES